MDGNNSGAPGGWVKTYRKLRAWEWYKDSNMVHLFIHLLLSANHEPAKWRGIDIMPGQLVTGRKALSEDTGISEQTIRTCLSKLKSTSEITIKSTNQFSLITITNWDICQGKSTSVFTSDQPATNQRPTTNKNDKNGKKKEQKDSFVPEGDGKCPYEEIVAAYHECSPQLPKVRALSETRKSYLRARWSEDKERQDLGWWREFFSYVAKSDFLTGRVAGKNGAKAWNADFEWIITAGNFIKILEGRYENR
jgi:hypothetical protein